MEDNHSMLEKPKTFCALKYSQNCVNHYPYSLQLVFLLKSLIWLSFLAIISILSTTNRLVSVFWP